MQERFERARGWRLWRWGNTQCLLWYCPKGQDLPAHRHPRMAATIVWLAGRMMWQRWPGRSLVARAQRFVMRKMTWRDFGRRFYIEADQTHAAYADSWGLFLVVERWVDGPALSSAAADFQRA